MTKQSSTYSSPLLSNNDDNSSEMRGMYVEGVRGALLLVSLGRIGGDGDSSVMPPHPPKHFS